MTQGKLTKDDLNPQFRAEIVDLITNGNSHIGSTISSETGVHGIRHHNNELSILKGSVWEQMTTGSNVQLHIGHLNNALTTGLYTVMGPLSLTDGSPIEVFETDKTLIEVFSVGEGQIVQRFTVFTGAPSIERYMRCKLDNQWLVDYPLTVGVVINGWIRENVPLSNSYSSPSDKTAASSKVANILYELINGHMEDSNVHVTNEERAKWNNAPDLYIPQIAGHEISAVELDTTLKSLVVANINGAYWYIETKFYMTKDVDSKQRVQIATRYNDHGDMMTRNMYNGNWSPWSPSLQSLFQSASDVKTNVASAITAKGVSTSPTATGAQMAANIRAIPTGKKFKEFFIPVNLAPGAQQEYTVELGFVPRYSSHQTNGYFLMNSGRLGSPRLDSPSVMDVRAVGTQIKLTIRNGLTTQYDHPGTIHYATD